MGNANRGESAFTFLSDVVSLLGRATRPLAPLSLSPWQLLLSIVCYQPLLLGESRNSVWSRARGDISSFSSISAPCSLHRGLPPSPSPNALAALISPTHLWCCVTSRRLVYPVGLYSCVCDVTPFSSAYINVASPIDSRLSHKPNDSST